MATNIVQMTDGSGNKQYPVTSAEAVGMPDGSGNLQNYLNKRVTELNISVLYPTQGIGGSNKYDLATAITQVPAEYRSIVGLKITFINNATSKPETWKYNGGTFTTTTNWVQGDGSGGNLILAWNTDVATTRKQVPLNKRKEGLQISYTHPDLGMVCEQYIGTKFTDTYWSADGNWDRILTELDYEKRGYSVIKEYPGLKNDEGRLIGSNNSEYSPQYTDISGADYIDAVVRCFVANSAGITFWNSEKSKIISYNANTGQYIDGNNFRFFLRKPAEAIYISVGAYQASDDINYLKLIKAPTGTDIININNELSEHNQQFNNHDTRITKLEDEVELLSVLSDEYLGLQDQDGYNICAGIDWGGVVFIPLKGATKVECCLKVYSTVSSCVRIYNEKKSLISEYNAQKWDIVDKSLFIYKTTLSLLDLQDTPFYIGVNGYEINNYRDRLYLKLYKELNSTCIIGNREPIIDYMSSIQIIDTVAHNDIFRNSWSYNIGNDWFTDKVEGELRLILKAYYTNTDIQEIGLNNLGNIYLSFKLIGDHSGLAITATDGQNKFNITSLSESSFGYGQKAYKIDMSQFDLSKNDFTITLGIVFKSVDPDKGVCGITDIHLFKEMYYGDRPIVPCSHKSYTDQIDVLYYKGSEPLDVAVSRVKTGGTIYILDGDYYINNPVGIIKPISIIGLGKSIRLIGGKELKQATPYEAVPDVYTAIVNNDEVGYVGGPFIFQHDIPDSQTLIKPFERLHLYNENQNYRLPSSRIWKTDDINKVLQPQENGRLYYHIDTETNLLTFRIADGSSLLDNPIILHKWYYTIYGSTNKDKYNLKIYAENVRVENLISLYGAVTFDECRHLRVNNLKVLCVHNTPIRITNEGGCDNKLYRVEAAGGYEDGLDFGQPSEVPTIRWLSERTEFLFDNCWFHDNYGDGVSEHGNPRVHIKDSIFEYNGISGATPAGGESLYVNCIFRRNGWQSAERAGLYVLPADGDSHIVAIGCVSMDNYCADYGVLSFNHGGQVVSLQLYNCSSLQTDDITSSAAALYANIQTAGTRHGYLGLFNFVTNRETKFRGDKLNLTITQAPAIVE